MNAAEKEAYLRRCQEPGIDRLTTTVLSMAADTSRDISAVELDGIGGANSKRRERLEGYSNALQDVLHAIQHYTRTGR